MFHCRIIEISEYSYQVYYSFLKYLYTNDVDLAPDELLGECAALLFVAQPYDCHEDFFSIESFVAGLLDLANAYCEPDLKSRCQHLMRQSVNIDNVAILYETALRYEAQVK